MHANFADLTPDGFHFWMTLSPRTSEPVCHAPMAPLEQNSGNATVPTGLDFILKVPISEATICNN